MKTSPLSGLKAQRTNHGDGEEHWLISSIRLLFSSFNARTKQRLECFSAMHRTPAE